MKGLELARAFYEEYGRPMLEEQFPKELSRIAVGLCGHGSECFGFDDEISRDHDFEPGFCLWLTEEDERAFGFRLFRAYNKLPKEYAGVKLVEESVFGSRTRGVHTIGEFYSYYTGRAGAPDSNEAWLNIPSFFLAEATNGEVFTDPLGIFSSIREEIRFGMPQDVKRKRLASALFLMAQTGQYNFPRCLSHGEKGGAALALAEFGKAAIEAIFLLNDAYAPYYKWALRAMKGLPLLGEQSESLTALLCHEGSDREQVKRAEALCREVACCVSRRWFGKGLSAESDCYLEPLAYRLNETIADGELRNRPLPI